MMKLWSLTNWAVSEYYYLEDDNHKMPECEVSDYGAYECSTPESILRKIRGHDIWGYFRIDSKFDRDEALRFIAEHGRDCNAYHDASSGEVLEYYYDDRDNDGAYD